MFINFLRSRAFGTSWILNVEEDPISSRKYTWKDDASWVDAYIWKDLGAWLLNSDAEAASGTSMYVWDDFRTWKDERTWKDGTIQTVF